MAIDYEAKRQRRLQMFRQVAAERLTKLNLLWIELEGARSDTVGFLREAHTLKGEASLTGFPLASKAVHALESYVKMVRDRGTPPVQVDGDLVLAGLDLLSRLVQAEPDTPSAEAEEFIGKVTASLAGRVETPTPAPIVEFAPAAIRPPRPAATGAAATPIPVDAGGKTTPAPLAVKRESSIRITAEKIDRLRGMVSDLLLTRVRWRQLTRALRRLRESAESLRSEARGECDGDGWVELRGGLTQVESCLRDEMHDLERLTGELDSSTRELRMIPLATLLDHFPLPLRQLARSLGRQIRLQVTGEQVEVDKALLEVLEEPLLHLLRNAVDHGVEPPDERERVGKPREATIRIVAGLAGQRLRLDVSDDGRGIDVTAVRRRATALGLVDASVAETLPEGHVLRMIFAAGFSTREQASEISGRGIGLNIVLDVVENLGGKVEVRSELGHGTSFDIEVPLTVAITRVVVFQVGSGTYALPAASVRSIVQSHTLVRADGPDGPTVEYARVPVPLLDLCSALDEPEVTQSEGRLIIAQSGADLVALGGTRGHVEREVMLKPMGMFFEKLPLVAAAVNLEEGALALVLKAAELILLARSCNQRSRTIGAAGGQDAEGRVALVADDSPVVRDIIAQALRSYGLHVLVAGDGEEALALFGTHSHVDIVVTDIDMPRLDGIGLVRILRSREGSKDTPVVAISMRGSEPEKRAAMEAGMSAYIDKSDFNQSLLWQTIRPFVVRS